MDRAFFLLSFVEKQKYSAIELTLLWTAVRARRALKSLSCAANQLVAAMLNVFFKCKNMKYYEKSLDNTTKSLNIVMIIYQSIARQTSAARLRSGQQVCHPYRRSRKVEQYSLSFHFRKTIDNSNDHSLTMPPKIFHSLSVSMSNI